MSLETCSVFNYNGEKLTNTFFPNVDIAVGISRHNLAIVGETETNNNLGFVMFL